MKNQRFLWTEGKVDWAGRFPARGRSAGWDAFTFSAHRQPPGSALELLGSTANSVSTLEKDLTVTRPAANPESAPNAV